MSDMKVGVLASLDQGPEQALSRVREQGFQACQITAWDPAHFSPENAAQLRQASERHQVEIATFWAGWPGPKVWNFTEGPLTLGIVPTAYRAVRVEALKLGANFARAAGLTSITTHVGFIPEDPNDRLYREVIVALQDVAGYCRRLGLQFWFETGQETPVTLLRAIHDIGLDNLGVNLDPANLILYGKANPVDALDVFGQYVTGVHAKDGLYPTEGRQLGHEVPLGEGKVNFPALLSRLKALHFQGVLAIEREISGEGQLRDIQTGKAYLEQLLATTR